MATALVSVEVLNSSYEPLGTTKLSRAIALVERGEAVIEEDDPTRKLTHEKGAYVWPKIIRMLRYVKVSLRSGPKAWTKAGVLKRDGFICAYCGGHGDTVDHILPKSKGGRDEWLNTCASCLHCNHFKGSRTPAQAGMVLHITPTVPLQTRIFGSRSKRH